MNNKDALSKSNSIKQHSGKLNNEFINEKLTDLKKIGVIKDFKVEQNFSHNDFSYTKQFLVNFIIETFDNKFIVVRSSASFRLDRVKTGFYDLYGVQNFSNF